MAREYGTKMWCPHCKGLKICRVVSIPYEKQVFYMPDNEDIQVFQRFRVCQICETAFTTFELIREHVDELVSLRNSVFVLRSTTNMMHEFSISQEKEKLEFTEKEAALDAALQKAFDAIEAVKQASKYLNSDQVE